MSACPTRFFFLPLSETEKLNLTPGELFLARGFGLSDKWLPGIVQDAVGFRMVTLEVPTITIRRHAHEVCVQQRVALACGSPKPSYKNNSTLHLFSEVLQNSLHYTDQQNRRHL